MSILHRLSAVAHHTVNARREQLKGRFAAAQAVQDAIAKKHAADLAALDAADQAIDHAADNPEEIGQLIAMFAPGGLQTIESLFGDDSDDEPEAEATATAAPSEPEPGTVMEPPPADPDFDPRPAALEPHHIDAVHRELDRQGTAARQSVDGLVNRLPELGAELVSAAVEHLVGTGLVERVGDGVIRLITGVAKSL